MHATRPMHPLRPALALACIVVLSALAAAGMGLLQGTVENGGFAPLADERVSVLEEEQWDAQAGTCTAGFKVEDPTTCAVAIVRASSGPLQIKVNGTAVEPKEYADARQASVVTLAGIDLPTDGQGAADVEVELATARWDASDCIYVGTETAVVNAFVIDYRVVNAVSMAVLAIMILYGLSLYLSKRTETYLRPFIAYASLLMFWLAMTNAPRSGVLPFGLFDFVQVCGHFYVAYIPFAICVLLSGSPIPRVLRFFFRWQGLLLVPLAFGAVGFLTSFGLVMAAMLLACLAYGGFALVASCCRDTPGAPILLVGFGVTMGLKVMAFLVDYGLVADSVAFFTLRKSRFLNVFVLLAVMVFLNRRFAANFRRTEDQSAVLDSMVAERTAELQRQQQLRLGMMANIFHDLRTPLFAIRSCVDNMGAGMAGSADAALLKDRVSLLSRLIEDLFTAAKLEDDDVVLAEEPVDLRETLLLAVEASRPLAREAGVDLRCKAEGAYCTWGDAHYLARAFENLIANAVQHAPKGSAVEIRLWHDGESACASVRNEGAGIDPADMPHIFERYYHRSRTARDHASSGLGLSIAQAVIRKHRGDISVESEPGRGCTFTASLPVLAPENDA